MNLDKIIEDFNDGDHDVVKFFSNRYDVFFKFLKKNGRLDDIADDYQNYLLLYYYEADREKFYKYCAEFLGDIHFVNNKEIYIIVEPEDLSALFCNNRDYSLKTIEEILSGNYTFDWYGGYDIDVYDNVVDELDTENIIKLKEIIVEKLKDIQLSPETEVLELIASEQGHIEFAIINSDNIHKVINDKETMESLFNDELSELESELKSLYHTAENSAIESEYYEEIWSELRTYFDGKPEWVSVRHGYSYDKEGNAKPRFIDKIKIRISEFDSYIIDYLNDNKNYGNQGTLEYQGSFIGILKESVDCLRLSFPDYASHTEIEKNINSYFGDYIY